MTTNKLHTPVLLLVFNRPLKTRRVVEALRRAGPERLYISADGPRTGRPGEKEICEEVRRIATGIDWPCEVKTHFYDANMGCKKAVSEGISWFFKHEEEGIILEDDVLPNLSFFQFCQELLERYRRDERVMSISGMNSRKEPLDLAYSYYFSRYCLMWGWATWRRAWECYDPELSRWPELKGTGWLLSAGDGSYPFRQWWEKTLDDCYENRIDTWDFQWIFSCWLHGGYSIHPSVNLVRNIGFGREATHTRKEKDFRAELRDREITFPLTHPDHVNRLFEADRYLDRNWFEIHWYNELKRGLLKSSIISKLASGKRKIRNLFDNR